MEQYSVTGMSCAACSARVEKAVSKVAGVTSCSVSLLTNSMGVEGTASPEEIIAAVKSAGYGAALKGAKSESGKTVSEDDLKDRETPKLLARFIASFIFLLPLLYIHMGHMLLGWPLPSFFDDNHVAMGGTPGNVKLPLNIQFDDEGRYVYANCDTLFGGEGSALFTIVVDKNDNLTLKAVGWIEDGSQEATVIDLTNYKF